MDVKYSMCYLMDGCMYVKYSMCYIIYKVILHCYSKPAAMAMPQTGNFGNR